jgi:hypothetical protein
MVGWQVVVGSVILPFVRERVASIEIPAVAAAAAVVVIVIILWNGGGMAVQWLTLHSSALRAVVVVATTVAAADAAVSGVIVVAIPPAENFRLNVIIVKVKGSVNSDGNNVIQNPVAEDDADNNGNEEDLAAVVLRQELACNRVKDRHDTVVVVVDELHIVDDIVFDDDANYCSCSSDVPFRFETSKLFPCVGRGGFQ